MYRLQLGIDLFNVEKYNIISENEISFIIEKNKKIKSCFLEPIQQNLDLLKKRSYALFTVMARNYYRLYRIDNNDFDHAWPLEVKKINKDLYEVRIFYGVHQETKIVPEKRGRECLNLLSEEVSTPLYIKYRKMLEERYLQNVK